MSHQRWWLFSLHVGVQSTSSQTVAVVPDSSQNSLWRQFSLPSYISFWASPGKSCIWTDPGPEGHDSSQLCASPPKPCWWYAVILIRFLSLLPPHLRAATNYVPSFEGPAGSWCLPWPSAPSSWSWKSSLPWYLRLHVKTSVPTDTGGGPQSSPPRSGYTELFSSVCFQQNSSPQDHHLLSSWLHEASLCTYESALSDLTSGYVCSLRMLKTLHDPHLWPFEVILVKLRLRIQRITMKPLYLISFNRPTNDYAVFHMLLGQTEALFPYFSCSSWLSILIQLLWCLLL